jgi:hypothetical protein
MLWMVLRTNKYDNGATLDSELTAAAITGLCGLKREHVMSIEEANGADGHKYQGSLVWKAPETSNQRERAVGCCGRPQRRGEMCNIPSL